MMQNNDVHPDDAITSARSVLTYFAEVEGALLDTMATRPETTYTLSPEALAGQQKLHKMLAETLKQARPDA